MKKSIITLLAVAMIAISAPAFAIEHNHDASQKTMSEQCARECEMLLKDCNIEVDSIQQRINKLQVEINEKGASTYTRDELRTLNKKLKEANETLRVLQAPR
jgi:peptidoglycan hydrolase CwlO-like protein